MKLPHVAWWSGCLFGAFSMAGVASLAYGDWPMAFYYWPSALILSTLMWRRG